MVKVFQREESVVLIEWGKMLRKNKNEIPTPKMGNCAVNSNSLT
jgi:hypothetical protein